ncbi:erythromycin esterase family protein [Hymenobacter sp. J193]|uniref:erythromycin esterase family protein n=1 Tax=Hymenobacter sp. J193 TaxID=2898429 RepID=UPI002150F39B|nr:erythromycin esterase family protein [Hymenobacter sp. J193]MCR5888594.1 erythromycin esterase family protein [Hymenobacter sp. J193]
MTTTRFSLKTLVCAASIWLGAAQAHAQSAEAVQPTARFANVPASTIKLGSKDAFPAFDAAFYRNELFLLGEAHGVQRPQEIDLALLKHLNERAGVRTYVAEVDCAKAYYLNEYLRTGQEATLDLIFRSWNAETSQWANQELRAKFQQIRSWNQTLPKKRQVRFLGLDQLQDLPLAADYLTELLPLKGLNPTLRGQLDSVTMLLRQPQQAGAVLAAVAQRALRTLQQPEGNHRTALGSRYEDVRHLLVGATQNRSNMLVREKNIFANFQALYEAQHLAGQKLYGFWGLAHVLQSPLQSGATLFAGMVRQSTLPVHNKVVSLMCVFADCQMLLPGNFLPTAGPAQRYVQSDKFNHDGPLTLINGMAELTAQTQPGSTTLFQLNAPAAATTQQPIQVSYAPGVPRGQQIHFRPELPATAYVQYLILVRNSAAVQALQP